MSDINEAAFGFFPEDSDNQRASDNSLELTHSRCMAAMAFEMHWESNGVQHNDCLMAQKLNLWRDILPFELEQELMGKPVDHFAEYRFDAGQLIPPYQPELCFNTKQQAFNRQFRKHFHIEPRAGRFYPRGFIAGNRNILPEDIRPMRVGNVTNDMLTLDLNAPMAGHAVSVKAHILDIWSSSDEHGGVCNDIAEMLTSNGPGMQARWRGQATDFWSDQPFDRMDTRGDADYYAMPGQGSPANKVTTQQIHQLYHHLLPKHGRILDLMAGSESYIDNSYPGDVYGLGIDRQALDANGQLAHRIIHDLNTRPVLPYADNSFDGVVCSLAVEYLVQPFEVFAEIARILKPGSPFILTFSKPLHVARTIRIWEGSHEFERPGIVLEYFLRDDLFSKLHSWSMRGLERPMTDKRSAGQGNAATLYAVWGSKS